MSQHTPGPWKSGPHCTTVYGPPEPGWDGGRLVASCGGATGRSLPVQHANTRLVAAAPDLLQACKDGVAQYADGIDPDSPGDVLTMATLRAAIAKAEGGAS